MAYLLGTLKRARNGQFNTLTSEIKPTRQPVTQPCGELAKTKQHITLQKQQRASLEHVAEVMAQIRTTYRVAGRNID